MDCPICLQEIKNSFQLECMHSFCQICINIWKDKSNTCPVCRGQITSLKTNYSTIYSSSNFNTIYDSFEGCNVIKGMLHGFTPTLSKYLLDDKILLCTRNHHQFIIHKPNGIIIECLTCNKIHSFNWLN